MIPEGDMSGLLAQAQAMQEQLFAAQQELADTEVEGTAGAAWSGQDHRHRGAYRADHQARGRRPRRHRNPRGPDPGGRPGCDRLSPVLATSKLGPLAGGLGGDLPF